MDCFIMINLISLRQGHSWNMEQGRQTAGLSNPISLPTALRLQMCVAMAAFYVDAEKLRSDRYLVQQVIIATDPSP